MKKHFSIMITAMVILLAFAIVAAASVGSADLSMEDSLRLLVSRLPIIGSYIDISQISGVYETIVFKVRMPRILLSAFTGCGLAVVGACFQGLFRNPLADPHILGVSSGAAVGATLAILSGVQLSFLGLGMIGAAAFVGAVLAILFVYTIASQGKQIQTVNLLLTGTAVSSMLSAVISLFMSMNREQIEKVYLWTLGSFSAATWNKVGFLAIFIFVGCAVLIFYSEELDMISIGEETAKSLGVDTGIVIRGLLAAASLMVAACVSVSGIIGFVGLIIPHCVRMLYGSGHRRLFLLSALLGSVFMIFCDTVARTITAPSEIPVGVVTALFGTPFFIYLLQRNKNKE